MGAVRISEAIFWACLALVLHTYLLYPAVLFLTYSLTQVRRDLRFLVNRRNRRVSSLPADLLPSVSLIIPAYNEEPHLPAKLANLRQLDYPVEKMEVIFVSDGSTDGTNRILGSSRDPNIHVAVLPVRRGKSEALNRGVALVRNQILVFSDAATLFAPDAVKKLVRHFTDPSVGVVCGALRFQGSAEFRETEGLYWKYESLLRLMEARLGATLTASGAIYALRRDAYCPLTPRTLIDDFVIPMNGRKRGYLVLYDCEAVATDFAAPSMSAEFARRVRLAVGSFRALGQLARTPMRGFTAFAFFSHKLLRWVLPFLLVGLLGSSASLAGLWLYRMAFVGQLAFYLWACLGFLFHRPMRRVRFGLLGYFLMVVNVAFLVGFVRFLFGHEEVKWQRAQ